MPLDHSTRNRLYILALREYEEDDLLIEEMTGTEGISELFEFRLRVQSARDDIDPARIIGKPAILRIQNYESGDAEEARHWNGCVSRFVRAGRRPSTEGEDVYLYDCDIVPWFWFMTQQEDCRIFQNKTVPEIVETIFGEFQYDDFKMEVTGQHPVLEYCTQYRETTFDFISRLIEREGIYYYFRHNDDGGEPRHILVFTDNKDSNPALHPDRLPFHHAGHAEDYDAIRTLSRDEQMRTRKVTVHGWNYQSKTVYGENTPTVLDIGADRDLERYRYPGEIPDAERAKQWSRVAMEAEESSHLRYRGESDIRILAPGHTFTLYDHPLEDFEQEYMVVSVAHRGRNNLPGQEQAADYANRFTLQPRADVFRPPQGRPSGLVRGPQTAVVVGPRGEEVYTDALGRIKVRFHWDRKVPGRSTDMPDDKASCWIRVAQMWAGNGYGTMFIPRIGMEVVVDFLEGDPDQPIVTGCVYNGVNKPPLNLPADATRSTIKTLSSKGGGGTNELRFEDKKGSEELFLQAERAMNVLVKASKVERIGGNSDLNVEGKRTVMIRGDHHQVMWGDWFNSLVGDSKLGAQGEMQFKSLADATVLSTGGNVCIASQVGNVEAKASVAINLDASMISLKSGASSITLTPGMIQIQAPMVTINSGGSGTSVAMPSVSAKMNEAGGVAAAKDGKVTDPVQQLQSAALRAAAMSAQPFCAMCHAAQAALRGGAH